MDTRREQIIDIVTREFIGPDPILLILHVLDMQPAYCFLKR